MPPEVDMPLLHFENHAIVSLTKANTMLQYHEFGFIYLFDILLRDVYSALSSPKRLSITFRQNTYPKHQFHL